MEKNTRSFIYQIRRMESNNVLVDFATLGGRYSIQYKPVMCELTGKKRDRSYRNIIVTIVEVD